MKKERIFVEIFINIITDVLTILVSEVQSLQKCRPFVIWHFETTDRYSHFNKVLLRNNTNIDVVVYMIVLCSFTGSPSFNIINYQ